MQYPLCGCLQVGHRTKNKHHVYFRLGVKYMSILSICILKFRNKVLYFWKYLTPSLVYFSDQYTEGMPTIINALVMCALMHLSSLRTQAVCTHSYIQVSGHVLPLASKTCYINTSLLFSYWINMKSIISYDLQNCMLNCSLVTFIPISWFLFRLHIRVVFKPIWLAIRHT